MELVSVGDRIEEGIYGVHSRFHRAVNLTDGNRLVSVVDEEIGAGPLNLVVRGLDLSRISFLRIDQRAVLLDGRRLGIAPDRYYRSGIDLGYWRAQAFWENLVRFGKLLVEISPPKSLVVLLDERRMEHFRPGFERAIVERIASGVGKVFAGDLLGGIKSLRGCGFGLTPSGDDFIAGLLIGMNLLQRMYGMDLSSSLEEVFQASRSGNLLSDTLLYLAKEGLLCQRMKKLTLALFEGGKEEIRSHAERLLLVGETSGADLGTGFYLTVQSDSWPWLGNGRAMGASHTLAQKREGLWS